MHFLVTGGLGFIGSHLLEELLLKGYRITVIDNFLTGKLQNLPDSDRLRLIEKSVLSCNSLDLPEKYDGLVHLAATPSVTQSWLEPMATHENNISATVAVIQLCQQLSIPRLVFASSAAVYGNPQAVPIAETAPTQPISPYGLQKLAGEQYIALFSQYLGISSVSLRLFNVFGPRQDPNSPYSGVISIFSKAMREGRSISINGDGSQTRDFIYVKDVATAFAQALTISLAPGASLVCNIGTSKAISLIQLKNTLQACFPEWQAETIFTDARPGDIQASQANITIAQQFLNFAPRYTLQEGLLALKASLA
ncbi:NAD-dependent epimerase/dehydratase family protein [Trichothermofontia sp.]